jgi:hypothetical protein
MEGGWQDLVPGKAKRKKGDTGSKDGAEDAIEEVQAGEPENDDVKPVKKKSKSKSKKTIKEEEGGREDVGDDEDGTTVPTTDTKEIPPTEEADVIDVKLEIADSSTGRRRSQRIKRPT